jgi:collagenase-like PrtC family protease
VTLMLAGVQNDLPTGTQSLPLEGQTLTPAQVATQLQAYLTAVANLAAARQLYANTVASTKPVTVATRALMLALVAWVKVQFGSTNAEGLAKFGVQAKTPKATSLASKTAAAAKSAATRAAKQGCGEAPFILSRSILRTNLGA